MHTHYTFETAGASAEVVGPSHGLSRADFDVAEGRAERAIRALADARAAGEAGFLDLPLRTDLLVPMKSMADEMASRFDTLVVVGMGGSALGARALVQALAHPLQASLPANKRGGRPRVLVLDTADPSTVLPVIDSLPPETTAWNLVSKSGNTLETLATWGVLKPRLQSWLGARWRDHVVVTTDPAAGPLREEADREKIRTLPVPPSVGGRFSVLSAVGLFPAAVAGIDVDGLLRGATAVATRFDDASPTRNDALRLALWLTLLAELRGKRHHVLVAYRQGLGEFAAWWQQLWAESLGKNGKGYEATPAVGSAAQHSLLQLWTEGPADKAFLFIEIDDPGTDAVLGPPAPTGAPWLLRRTLGDVHHALASGTRASLARRNRPALSLRLPRLDAEHLGALMHLLLVTTAVAGPLSSVNPFGQPGVEEGKNDARALLGREEDRERRANVEDLLDRLRRSP
jgi:glucose-6-phosphate isomerase